MLTRFLPSINGEILDGIRETLRRLSSVDVGAVILSSGLKDIYISHYDVGEIAGLASLVPQWLNAPSAGLLHGCLRAESFLSWIGARWLVRKSPMGGLSDLNSYHECTHLLRSIPQVTIAMINGRSFGGGCELALACDFRIMADTPGEGNSRLELRGSGIGQPEITLGLIPGGGGTQMLTHMLGPAGALDICLRRPLIEASEALKLGLVHELSSYQDLRANTISLAKRMATRSPAAVAAIKNCVHVGATQPIGRGMQVERSHFAAMSLNPESQKAMLKYLDEMDGLLGSKKGFESFESLQQGTFSSFVPGTARSGEKAKIL